MAKKEKEDELIEVEVEVKDKKQYYTIEEHDFKMESSRPNDIRFFDLYYIHTVNKGKGEKERQEFKLEGYGISFRNCLLRIAAKRAGNSDKREYKSIKEFVIEYTKQVNEVKILLDTLPKNDD